MRVFVTGATGFIGSAVVQELLEAGHEVLGLARSRASADTLVERGAQAHRGSLEDLDSLASGARAADGVVHLGFSLDVADLAASFAVERAALGALGTALEGSDKALVFASGTAMAAIGRVLSEDEAPDLATGGPRAATEVEALALAERGVRAVAVRMATAVHGPGDTHGFLPLFVGAARAAGTSAYVDQGANRLPGVHRRDAATVVRRALESGGAGTRVHAVSDTGVPFRAIAEAIGAGLGIPTVGLDRERAGEHFAALGGFAAIAGMDIPADNTLTRARLDWAPTHPGLLDELAAGHYFPQL